ncbi:MAG: ABC transporter ATP-binding protein [Lachnospiraceae bacterium]|nr:ABC transporter ATP-binding protein [Lachnospiraceae bacterium]
MDKVLSIKDLNLWFDGDYSSPQILKNINIDVYKGETLGIAGESGCGKSVTSLSVLRLLKSPPARIQGTIEFHGQNLLELSMKEMQKIRGNKIAMIFQEPMTSLNPLFKVGYQLEEVFRLHQGLGKDEAKKKAVEMLDSVRIPLPEQRAKEYPFQLSGGMRQRVMIAMALSCRPELLIADEPTTALDVTIQAQVLDLMRQLQKEFGTAIMFITHDLGVIREVCDRVVIMYCGEIVETAKVDELFANPSHPYTHGLLSTLPQNSTGDRLATIPGMVPPAGKFPSGCVFAPRCKYSCEECVKNKPELYDIGNGHSVKCFRFKEKEVQ